ncbi:hypothetical protein H6F61_06950 [Cyanobacteria bacterium FACHB-472]|nr:hypothetical protein [Cyanobacteria bacterium FACHB-472]
MFYELVFTSFQVLNYRNLIHLFYLAQTEKEKSLFPVTIFKWVIKVEIFSRVVISMVNKCLHKWKAKEAALLLFAVFLAACNPSSTPEATTTISKVVNKSAKDFIGKTITVNGEVEEIIGSKAFLIEGETLFIDPVVLIVSAKKARLIEDSHVRVTGKVTTFILADIERNLSFDLEDNLFKKYEGESVIIASDVTLTPEPGEVGEEPDKYFGQVVTVTSNVEKVISPNTFLLDDQELIGGKELLVIGAVIAGDTIKKGEIVEVTGLVRKFVKAEIERDFDFNLQPELKIEYENQPVIIAQSVKRLK